MKLIFRFDIDTHKCIREGVPKLLNLSNEVGVPFTFFLNLGRAISFVDSVKDMLKPSSNDYETTNKIMMMSAREKLGNKDYLVAAICNPRIGAYKKEIRELCNSRCEVGIHGGKNHALWYKYAKTWDKTRIESEVDWAVNCIKKIDRKFEPTGFASPGWSEPSLLLSVLKSRGFSYSADLRSNNQGEKELIKEDIIPRVGVNLLGEPGGVAFFENRRVLGWTTQHIVDYVLDEVKKNQICVIYDHPYYAGIKELETIKEIIVNAYEDGIEICNLKDLL